MASFAIQEAGSPTPFMALVFFTTKAQPTQPNLQITKTLTLSIRIIGTIIKVSSTTIRRKALALFIWSTATSSVDALRMTALKGSGLFICQRKTG